MAQGSALLEVIVFLAAIAVVVPLARRLRFAPVLGYLAAGAAIGPYGFGLVHSEEVVHWLGELGVVFLLFAIGLELSFTRLRAIPLSVLALSLLQIALTAVALGAAFGLDGWDWRTAAVVGVALAFSSTALVATLLAERGELLLRFGRITIAVLLLQDVAAILALLAVPLLGDGSRAAESLLWEAGKAVVAVAAIVILGRLLLPRLLRLVAAGRSTEVMIAATASLVLGFGLVGEAAGLSMVLGAFLGGVLLADTEFRHSIEADIEPVRGILMALFFMSVAMATDLSPLVERPLTIAAAVAAVIALKAAVVVAAGWLTRQPAGLSLRMGLALCQAGEFGFILLALGRASGVVPTELISEISLVIVGTMALTSILIPAGAWMAGGLERRRGSSVDELEKETIDLADHVIVAGFGRVGRTVTRLLMQQQIPVLALDVDAEGVRRARESGLPVYFGDATRPDVLRAVGAERARAIVLTLDKTHMLDRFIALLRWRFPQLAIYARARDRGHAHRLLETGATVSIPETFEASLRLAQEVMTAHGIPEDVVNRAVNVCRVEEFGAAP